MEKPAFIEPPLTVDYVRPRFLSSDIFLLYIMGLKQYNFNTSGSFILNAFSALCACRQGYNITMGSGCYMNFNCCFLDCAPIKIGKDVRLPAAPALFN